MIIKTPDKPVFTVSQNFKASPISKTFSSSAQSKTPTLLTNQPESKFTQIS